jgi:hypothetical protein
VSSSIPIYGIVSVLKEIRRQGDFSLANLFGALFLVVMGITFLVKSIFDVLVAKVDRLLP